MSISEHKHMPQPVRRIEVFTGAGRRRSWSGEEKAAIIAESYGSGETVCAVARRHGLTPQQLVAWRRLARRTAESAGESGLTFAPVVVAPPHRRTRVSWPSTPTTPSGTSTIEVVIGAVTVRGPAG